MTRLHHKTITALTLLLITTALANSYPVIPEKDVICPDSDPLNCYPKLFQATSEWKVIKEGQMIPAGLEVQMDFETNVKQARLDPDAKLNKKKGLSVLDSQPLIDGGSGSGSQNDGVDVGQVNLGSNAGPGSDNYKNKNNEYNKNVINRGQGELMVQSDQKKDLSDPYQGIPTKNTRQPKINYNSGSRANNGNSNPNDGNSMKKNNNYHANDNSFESSMNYVIQFVESPSSGHYDDLMSSLEYLSDLSSDSDFGVSFVAQIQTVLKLTGLYDSNMVNFGKEFGLNHVQYDKVKELTTRCLSSALRNNAAAQKTLGNYLVDKSDFMTRLMAYDSSSDAEDVLLLKRRLSVLGALITTPGSEYSKVFSQGGLKGKLLDLFYNVSDSSVKQRITEILEDLKLQGVQNVKRDEVPAEDTDLTKLAKYTEEYLIETRDQPLQDERLKHLKRLQTIKQTDNGSFRASADFLNWLSDEIHSERERIGKRDLENVGGDDHVDYLVMLRHEVFGNRLASRKVYVDEL
ncbi:unnamed protein product [Ambrosiozyma monospora]|uniref:Nucleotide exchange factor SIL1 n=1 Tax=Ambrosiozyma monospora TaxID=43982 RepID=A0A9W7DH86_AMBMO|nr:unnamed protein product [Ambrosiozyma monospora]